DQRPSGGRRQLPWKWVAQSSVARGARMHTALDRQIEGRENRSTGVLLATQGVECFFQALADAGEDRGIPQGIAAAFGFPQRHDEVKEVFRLVAFEGHDPFLIVETE